MIKKLDNANKKGNDHIRILYPGLDLSHSDTGYYTVGRIDHADIHPGVVIKMHPHVNDDILSYFRTGKVKHTDSEGFEEYITPGRLMLMKAGSIFHHEEAILERVEGLQIFIRPAEKDVEPEVIFHDLEKVHSDNRWRLIASPDESQTKLKMSSDTYIFDTRLAAGKRLMLPTLPSPTFDLILYVFQGTITVNKTLDALKGESVFIQGEPVEIVANHDAELVLFATNTTSKFYDQGMFSGNKI